MSAGFERSTRSSALQSIVALLVATAICGATAHAQQGFVVRVETGGAPLNGALIALVGADNTVAAERLSTASGSASFDVVPGEYRVRVRRIGYRPFYSAPVTVPRSTPLVLTVESPRVMLQQVVVGASSQCGRINPDAAVLAELWEEISKALRASELTPTDLRGARAESYRREVDGDGVILSNDVRPIAAGANRPFGAPDPAALITRGYVRGDLIRGWEFFGPDEKVLLSDSFASTHCFRALRDKKKSELIGVAFRPVPKRTQGDIEGVIWLDQESSELREINFNFVNAGEITRFRPGGYSRFTRLPSGAWIVSDWSLRMPRLVEARGAVATITASGFVETGGRVVMIDEGPATGSAYVTGTVFDSLNSRPLSGARVTIGSVTVDTDREGQFKFAQVGKGTTMVSIAHPAIEELGLPALMQTVEVTGDTVRFTLSTPSRRTAWTRICGSAPDSSFENARGILHGYVRDESGNAVSNAAATISFTEYRPMPTTTEAAYPMSMKVVTGSDGHYAACRLKRTSVGSVSATYGTMASPRVEFSFDKSLIARRDLVMNRK
jgi:hypothetical protein